MPRLSLKARIAAAMTIVFVGSVGVTAWLGLRYFESEFVHNLYQQQFEIVSAQARSLDEKLTLSHEALKRTAQYIPRRAFADTEQAQQFMDRQFALHAIFDNGLFLISPDGKIIAESPFAGIQGRRGRDLSFREFIQATKETGKPYISKPFVSTYAPGQPAVVMTVPVFDEKGRLLGIFQGGLKLLGKNFLADLNKIKIGQTGYISVITSDRLVITHGDPARIMKPSAQLGQNPLLDQAIAGFEGSGRTVTSWGGAMYTSYKRLSTTGWIFAANYPVVEAEAPLRRARIYVAVALGVGTLIVLSLTWLIIRRMMMPLSVLTQHVQELPHKSGAERHLTLAAQGEVGTLGTAFNTMLDTLDQQQHSLRESEMRFRSLTDLSTDWYWEQDAQFRFTLMSQGLEKTKVGYHYGKTRWEMPILGISDEQWRLHREQLDQHQPFKDLTYQVRTEAGELRTFSVSGFPIFDEQGTFCGYRGIGSDITERMANEEKIERMAYHDALTGLPNRLLMQDRFEQAMAQAERTETQIALVYIDLDNFKNVNDLLGHEIGDALLRQVAARLHTCVRDTDTISRQGGDEFLICLRDLPDIDIAASIVAKLIESMQAPFLIEAQEISSQVSVGVAVFPRDGQDFETLRRKADMAMYRAKEAGRNTYRFYNDAMNAAIAEHMLLRNGLRHALEHGEFMLHYQPQLDLRTRAIIGVEALLRWNHPQRGLVPPASFIPIAEESGLIVPIGEWILQEACRQAVAWQQQGLPPLVVAVNLSAVQFKRGHVEQAVQAALQTSGLAPHLLELELTESTMIQNMDSVLASMTRLKQLGIKIAIDDFGTGYSSLSYLKQMDVDKLKIDQSFVRDLITDPDDAAIVKTIIQLAGSLGLRTIAEGVETEEIAHQLHLLQCDEGQGYLFARPLEAAALAQLLTPPKG